MPLITVDDIAQYRNKIDARHEFSDLIERLVRNAIPYQSLLTLRFPSHSATSLSGWDGLLACRSKSRFVPDGNSVWELGTGMDAVAKIRSDFTKRLEDPLPPGWTREQTTYVAATLQALSDPMSIVGDLPSVTTWKCVVVLDAVQLCAWIAESPAMEAQLFEIIRGRPLAGVASLQSAWRSWSSDSSPPVSTRLLLVGRSSEAAAVLEALAGGDPIQVRGDSSDEVVGFLYAALEDVESSLRESLLSRILVVSSPEAAEELVDRPPQIVMLREAAASATAKLQRAGHQVVQVVTNSSITGQHVLTLSRQPRDEFAAALVQMGCPPEVARMETRGCGASVSMWVIWSLLRDSDAEARRPAWARDAMTAIAAALSMLGAWSKTSEADLAIVAGLTGLSASDIDTAIHRLKVMNFVEIVSDVVSVSAPAVAFGFLGREIEPALLGRFEAATSAVFGAIDPLVLLEADERRTAAFEGVSLPHSSWLRRGLSETLLRIAVLGHFLDSSVFGIHATGQKYVDHVVRSLPGLRNDASLLSSLRDQLPILAEAAPEPFLYALETLLQGDQGGLQRLFVEGSDFDSSAMIPGVLWALETVAWSPVNLSRAVLCLGALAVLDPGGRMSNRPLSSIVDILLPWHPGTSASVYDRIASLDLLTNRHPDVAWRALLQLMPGATNVSSGTHRPQWRESRIVSSEGVRMSEANELYMAYISRAIGLSSQSDVRIAELAPSFVKFASQHRLEFISVVENSAEKIRGSGEHRSWAAIRQLLAHHKKYADAAWAAPMEVLSPLEDLERLLTPEDASERFAWLFSDLIPDLGMERSSIEDEKAAVSEARARAITEIWAAPNARAQLKGLVSASLYPGMVATAFIEIERDRDCIAAIFSEFCLGSRSERIFASQLSAEAFDRFDTMWIDLLFAAATASTDPSEAILCGLIQLPPSSRLFEIVARLDAQVQREFWSRVHAYVPSQELGVAGHMMQALAAHGRALDCLPQLGHEDVCLSNSEVLRIVELAVDELCAGKTSQSTTVVEYWLEKLLDRLRADSEVSRSSIATLEYRLLPILVRGMEKVDLTIHQTIAADPALFIRLLADLYRREDQETGAEDAGLSDTEREARRGRGRAAWDVLRSWRSTPGLQADGALDVAILRDWISAARALGTEAGRPTLTDQHIGNMLFHVPVDPVDHAWPLREVRDLLEEFASEEIERGIAIEQFNSRGATTKAMYEGGKQERQIAEHWLQMSEIVGLDWARTRNLLREISAYWDRHAALEDERSAKDRLRYS